MRRLMGIIAVVLLIGIVVIVLFAPPFERRPPRIELAHVGKFLGASTRLTVRLADRPAGLKRVSVLLKQGKREWGLCSRTFPTGVYEARVSVTVKPKAMGVKEGHAALVITACDRSLWHLRKGNTRTVRFPFTVDFTPPTVQILNSTRAIYETGAGAVLFATSKDAVKARVQVGGLSFKAYPKKEGDRVLWAALFGVPPHAIGASLVVEDQAGNRRVLALPFHLLHRRLVRKTIVVTDAFIQQKIRPLLPPESRRLPPVQAFKAVNEKLRRENEGFISSVASRSSGDPQWRGAFIQMRRSKVTATFWDQRTYLYRGKVVSHSIHLGYDLASVAHAPVPAANSGRVIFAGFVGIYGNVILIDHGLGLVSLYAHLSRMNVRPGEEVEKGEVIGYTDSTGLANGDHLHFGIFLSGHPVNPLEWWDKRWLRGRIASIILPYIRECHVQDHRS